MNISTVQFLSQEWVWFRDTGFQRPEVSVPSHLPLPGHAGRISETPKQEATIGCAEMRLSMPRLLAMIDYREMSLRRLNLGNCFDRPVALDPSTGTVLLYPHVSVLVSLFLCLILFVFVPFSWLKALVLPSSSTIYINHHCCALPLTRQVVALGLQR